MHNTKKRTSVFISILCYLHSVPYDIPENGTDDNEADANGEQDDVQEQIFAIGAADERIFWITIDGDMAVVEKCRYGDTANVVFAVYVVLILGVISG